MRSRSSASRTERVLTVSGPVGSAQASELRLRLLEEVGHGGGCDVILDTRQVSSFDDAALVALTAGRSRAKFLHHRIVLVDGQDGSTVRSLRRSGHIFRFPVYADAAAAGEGLSADRSALAARNPLSEA